MLGKKAGYYKKLLTHVILLGYNIDKGSNAQRKKNKKKIDIDKHLLKFQRKF